MARRIGNGFYAKCTAPPPHAVATHLPSLCVMKTKIYYKMTMSESYKLAVDKEHKCVVSVLSDAIFSLSLSRSLALTFSRG